MADGSGADGTAIKRRQQALDAARAPHVTTWRECFDMTYPLRGVGFYTDNATAPQVMDKQARLLDSTGTDSVAILASGIVSGTTPSNSRWVGFSVDNETDEEFTWLDNAADLLWKNIHNSNFDSVNFEAAVDLVIAGACPLFIDEGKNGGLVFEAWPLPQCFFGSTRTDGIIDIVHRKFPLTAEQAVKEYGAENLSEKITKLAADRPDDIVWFIHAIEPRALYVVGSQIAKNLPISSCHIEFESGKCVRESGFHEMPVVVPRWMRLPNSVYAIGQVFAALPAIRTLNELRYDQLASADMAIAGMWGAVDDGILNPKRIKIGPRVVVPMADPKSFFPLNPGGEFQLSEAMIAAEQAAIRKTLLADQLSWQPPVGKPMTATEVHARINMIRQLLGPIYGRMQSEYIKPLVLRCFGLALRAGIFAPMPQSLQSRKFRVTYLNPNARAQQLEDVAAIDGIFSRAANMTAVDPDILDLLDEDEAMRIVAKSTGVPESVMRSQKAVATLRASRQKQQAQAAQQQIAANAANAAGQAGGKAMGQQVAQNSLVA